MALCVRKQHFLYALLLFLAKIQAKIMPPSPPPPPKKKKKKKKKNTTHMGAKEIKYVAYVYMDLGATNLSYLLHITGLLTTSDDTRCH